MRVTSSTTGAPRPRKPPTKSVRKLGRPPKVKARDTRRRILDIARGVYAERGYEAATNKDIAELAKITTAALYYHFPSKRDLYLEVHEDARVQVYGRFEESIDPDASFAEQLLAVLNATHELNAEDPTLARFLAAARTDMKRRADLSDALDARIGFRRQFFDRMVDVGVRTGEIEPAKRDLVTVFIIAMMTGMTDALSDDQEVHARAIEAVRSIIAGDIVRPPRTPQRARAS